LLETILLAGMFIIAVRLYYLQIYKGTELSHKAMAQRQQSSTLIHRGSITDRHGLPLAIDTTRYDIYVHPELVTVNFQEVLDVLSRVTNQDRNHLVELFSARKSVITVARGLSREQVDELQSLNWTGLDIVPRSFRHYPEGKLAAHLLGYVNFDTEG